MRKILLFTCLTTIVLQMLQSCGNSARENAVCDSVIFCKVLVRDSVSFPMEKGGRGTAMAQVELNFPVAATDSVETDKIKSLLGIWIMGTDSLIPDSVFAKRYVEDMLSRFTLDEEYVEDDIHEAFQHESSENNIKVEMAGRLYPVYNRNDLLCICKENVTKYGMEEPSTEHTFININLASMKRIALDDIFKEEAMQALNALIKVKLIEQVGAKNENEMFELGYFNLDNLVATNNFRMDSDGITWVYLPLEIACFRVGESSVVLRYDEISDFMVNNNPLRKIIDECDR